MDQKESKQNINMKNYQNSYFRAKLGQKWEEILTLIEKKNRLTFNYRENLRFFNVQSL